MITNIKKWGNSAAIRIPTNLMRSISLDIDSEISIKEHQGKIIIEPVQKKYSLQGLLSKITTENIHNEADWGASEGKEEW